LPRTLFAWWYLSIAIGFVLLAVRTLLFGEGAWGVVLRLIIAVGFAALAFFEFRKQRPR
jgi:hypothetical protein